MTSRRLMMPICFVTILIIGLFAGIAYAEEVMTSEQWIAQGDRDFQKNEYDAAVASYSKALEIESVQ